MKTLFYTVTIFSLSHFAYSQVSDRFFSANVPDISASEQQKQGGSIIGTVIDIIDRNPIDNATVEILGTGLKFNTLKDGQFKISNVAQGFYQVRGTAAGYDLQTQNNLYVEEGKQATAFFMLKKIGLKETVENADTSPVPISTKSPSYPDEARKNGGQGIFYFMIEISETGSIVSAKCAERNVYAEEGKLKDAQVIQKYTQAVNQMEKEALESLWQWKFKPAMKDGIPISSRVTIPVKFKLDSSPKEEKKEKK